MAGSGTEPAAWACIVPREEFEAVEDNGDGCEL
jgi:hypothetical protein